MKDTNIIIVDDDRDLAESLAELLEVNGYQVEIASNGQEAVERFRHKDYDIAFMDVRMPVMNGVDSFFAIQQMKPQARIVMMTGFKEPILEKAIHAGAEGPLHKPFGIEQMLKLVETKH
jgi:two-component system, NtrC family, response regulator HydG